MAYTPETQSLCREFLAGRNGQTVDAMIAMRLMIEEQKLRIDWHEFAMALDTMERDGLATRAPRRGCDGMTLYTISEGAPCNSQ